jgi:hypothetical protein
MSKILNSKGYLKINNVFSKEDIDILHKFFENSKDNSLQEIYGRMRYFGPHDGGLSWEIQTKLTKKVNDLLGTSFVGELSLCVDYSNKYGIPDLPPHFDGDTTEIIVDYQLDSNTTWELGINKEVVSLENNSALVFNPNTNAHWRPRKSFNEGEYVRMVFFRFRNLEKITDYSHLRLSQDDPIYAEARAARDSLQNN